MTSSTMRSLFTGAIAVIAVGGGLAYALLAQQQGHSPEPPAWLALLIGGAVTYYYGQSASLNGSTAALTHFAAAVTARRATDPLTTAQAIADPPLPAQPGASITGVAGGTTPKAGS